MAAARSFSQLDLLSAALDGTDESEHATLLRGALAALLRGFAVGSTLRGGLALGRALTTGRAPRRADGLLALRFGLFLGTFASGFRIVEAALKRLSPPRALGAPQPPWHAAAAGALVAPAFLIADHHPSPSASIYVFLRACLLAARAAHARGRLFSSPLGRALVQHGAPVSMCCSASLLLHAWLLEPSSLDGSYVRFLTTHGGKGMPVLQALQAMVLRKSCGGGMDAVRKWWSTQPGGERALAALRCLDDSCVDPCAVTHPGQSHAAHALRFLVAGVPRALPVYVPVYLISTALVQRGRLLKHPRRILGRAALGVLRSSLFLSSYCALAWASCCAVHHGSLLCGPAGRPLSRATILICAFPAGLATLLEKVCHA